MANADIEQFRERYATSGEVALLAAEFEALGTSYQANGYKTLAQAGEEMIAVADALAGRPGAILMNESSDVR